MRGVTGNRFGSIRGFTLVELMVGILVSMVVVLGMVGVYRTVARNAAEVAIGTKIDSQVFSAMLAVDRILQGAGFGLPVGVTPSLGSTFSVTSDSVIWFVDSDHAYCNALISDNNGLRWFGATATDPGSHGRAFSLRWDWGWTRGLSAMGCGNAGPIVTGKQIGRAHV